MQTSQIASRHFSVETKNSDIFILESNRSVRIIATQSEVLTVSQLILMESNMSRVTGSITFKQPS
jgi:hypothetical protein